MCGVLKQLHMISNQKVDGGAGGAGEILLSSLKSKKRALETLAVVSPEGYVFAPANLFGNLPNEDQSFGAMEDRQPSE